jgi:hypothetical protein
LQFNSVPKTTEKLVATVAISGNTVIQPTAIDGTTGNITCPNHGLTTGDKIFLARKEGYLPSVIPFELFSAAISSINSLQAVVVDANTFQVRIQTGTPLTFTNASNTLVDATKFWFEKGCPSVITISGLSNLTNIKVELFGKICNSSYYLTCKLFNGSTEINNIEGQSNNNYQTVFDTNWTADAVNVNGLLTVKNNSYIVDTFKSYHLKTQSDYDYIKNNAALYYAKFTTTNAKTIGFMNQTRNITSIVLCDQGGNSNPGSGYVGYGAFMNGFTVKVYDLG